MPPERTATTRIAIVGGGLSGSLLLLQLLRLRGPLLELVLYEKRATQFCRGVAYSSQLPYQLLNVPVKDMSLFGDRPSHFHDWLRQQGIAAQPDDFVARRHFGDYVQATVSEALLTEDLHSVTLVTAEVNDIVPQVDGLRVEAGGLPARIVDKVFLCTGNFPPAELPGLMPGVRMSGRYIDAPWDGSYLAKVGAHDTVLIAGTGLSMVDQAMSLLQQSAFHGQVIALSRHGLLPLAHGPLKSYSRSTAPDFAALSLRELYRWFISELQRAQQEGSDFRGVFDRLRPELPLIWQGL
ncbi:MAG: FAD/NAD(P)-binding protein, partial [Pseudomonadota bacterium]